MNPNASPNSTCASGTVQSPYYLFGADQLPSAASMSADTSGGASHVQTTLTNLYMTGEATQQEYTYVRERDNANYGITDEELTYEGHMHRTPTEAKALANEVKILTDDTKYLMKKYEIEPVKENNSLAVDPYQQKFQRRNKPPHAAEMKQLFSPGGDGFAAFEHAQTFQLLVD